MPRRGRPPKLSPALAARFCELVGGGLSRARAAAALRVSPKSVCRWLRVGREGGKAECVQFVQQVQAAEARFVADQLAVVVSAAGPRVERVTRTTTRPDGSMTVEVTEREVCDWRAAAWLLVHKAADTFGPHRRELAILRRELAQLRTLVRFCTLADGPTAEPCAG